MWTTVQYERLQQRDMKMFYKLLIFTGILLLINHLFTLLDMYFNKFDFASARA